MSRAGQELLSIRLVDFQRLAGGSAKTFYVQFTAECAVSQRFAIPNPYFAIYWRLVGAALAERSQGVVTGTAYSISRACLTRPRCLHSALTVLEKAGLIQRVDPSSSRESYSYSNLELEKKTGHFQFPDWVFENVGMVRVDPATPNTYLTRGLYGRNVFSEYPAANDDAFEAVYEYLLKVIYDDAWLAFVQTCIRNYARRKKEKSDRPSFSNIDAWFQRRNWWEYVRRDDKTLPRAVHGTGRGNGGNGLGKHDPVHVSDTEWRAEHNISHQSQHIEFINRLDTTPAGNVAAAAAANTPAGSPTLLGEVRRLLTWSEFISKGPGDRREGAANQKTGGILG